jgi:hypothetical protein
MGINGDGQTRFPVAHTRIIRWRHLWEL